MPMILDGKLVSSVQREDIKELVKQYRLRYNAVPGLAVILVGGDPASSIYVSSKEKVAKELGFLSVTDRLPAETTTEDLLALINKYNNDDRINGILIQLPLPKQIDEKRVLRAVLPLKDVDGFHPYNVGLLNIGDDCLMSCTPAGIISILKYYKIDIAGKDCVIVGRSNIVGKPMATMMIKESATVTICHSKTKDLIDKCATADILISAIGKAKFIKKSFVKKDAVIIDVGMNHDEDGKLCGDVDFESVKEVASAITPVPGGVGPMTITTLMANTLKSFEMSLRCQ